MLYFRAHIDSSGMNEGVTLIRFISVNFIIVIVFTKS